MAVPGFSEPTDKFAPRMLDVEVPDDLASLFARARGIASGEDPNFHPGEKGVVILTPGRAFASMPPLPKEGPPQDLSTGSEKWPSPNADIAVISYTRLDALMDPDNGKLKCVPFLPRLMTMAARVHSVVVFEGHPSALEAGLHDTDVLLIDSGMLPFLQEDWMKVAVRAMRSGARYFVCGREKQDLREVIPASQPPGWLYREADGEGSYAFCLLTLLGKRPGRSASVTTGKPVPDLRTLTQDHDEMEWASLLPFQYEPLDAALVITTILRFAGVKNDSPRLIPGLRSHYELNARLAQKGGSTYCPFRLTLSGFGSRRHLEIVRQNF
jgi:hypothetical protein